MAEGLNWYLLGLYNIWKIWAAEPEVKERDGNPSGGKERGARGGDLPAGPPGALLAVDHSPGSPWKSTAGTQRWGKGERTQCVSIVVSGLYHVGHRQTWLAKVHFSTNLTLWETSLWESLSAWQLQQPLAKPPQDHWMVGLSVSGNTKALWTVRTL